jgi:hypothetical protein
MPGSEFTAEALAISPHAISWIGLSSTGPARQDADFQAVTKQFAEIEALIESGQATDARAACARLIYAMQPLIVSDAWLLSGMLTLFDRCGAHGLRRLVARSVGLADASVTGNAAFAVNVPDIVGDARRSLPWSVASAPGIDDE